MTWKRNLHRTHGTTLLETYSYEHREGRLWETLAKKLRSQGVTLRRKPDEEIEQDLRASSAYDFPLLVKLLSTFLGLFKSNQYALAALRERAAKRGQPYERMRAEAFLDIFEPLYERYQAHLTQRGDIDFSDMLAMATRKIAEGDYVSPFKHILVDEFQDTSVGRYKLLRALIDQAPDTRLFCVGDDWQSIFRFTGSDISLIIDFEDYFGFTKTTALKTTYRFHQGLADFSGAFIQKNPRQLRRTLSAARTSTAAPYEIVHKAYEQEEQAVRDVLARLHRKARQAGTTFEVFLLGRYNFTKPDEFWKLRKAFGGLSLQFLTVHRAKGLEADYVIVDDLIADKYGFPTEKSDDPLLSLVLTSPDDFPNAEERRLFYVAITRAREKVFLLTEQGRESSFITEIQLDRGDLKRCPRCGDYMVRRDGKYGPFWGCKRYPQCRHTEEVSYTPRAAAAGSTASGDTFVPDDELPF